jgi:peroxiredoxin
MGVAAALCRWICGGATDRLLAIRIVPGDIGVLGTLAGILLAGSLVDNSPPHAQLGQSPLAPGKLMDLAGPTLDGGRYDLANHRGKVVLVTFWASWCPRCRAELPNVRAVYDKYRADGLEVVGVSVDNKRDDLAKFVKAKGLPWPQIFFDESGKRGFGNPLARQYGIQGVPRLVLIDPEGKVATWKLRGPQIEWAVAKALGRSEPEGSSLAHLVRRLLGWLINCLMASPPWRMFLCVVGGAVLAALAEAGLRRVFQRRPAPGPA